MPRSRSCRAWRGGKARTSAEGERERDAEEGAVLYESLTRGRSEGTARGARSRGTDTRTNHHLRALRLHIRVGGVLHDNLLVTHGAGRCATLRDRKGTASSRRTRLGVAEKRVSSKKATTASPASLRVRERTSRRAEEVRERREGGDAIDRERWEGSGVRMAG